jgi:hypothetical protein
VKFQNNFLRALTMTSVNVKFRNLHRKNFDKNWITKFNNKWEIEELKYPGYDCLFEALAFELNETVASLRYVRKLC